MTEESSNVFVISGKLKYDISEWERKNALVDRGNLQSVKKHSELEKDKTAASRREGAEQQKLERQKQLLIEKTSSQMAAWSVVFAKRNNHLWKPSSPGIKQKSDKRLFPDQ